MYDIHYISSKLEQQSLSRSKSQLLRIEHIRNPAHSKNDLNEIT